MQKLKIAVLMKESSYALELARGLCCRTSGVEVFVAENENQAFKYAGRDGVVITDKNVAPEPQVLVLNEENPEEDSRGRAMAKISSVSEILDAVASICFENTGELFYPSSDDRLRIWEFTAPFGGAGTTCIAITSARLLAAETGKRVLYINFGAWDDYMSYIDVCFDSTCPKRKFIYAAETKTRIIIDKCVEKDRYGVFYFKPENAGNSFLREANADKVFEFIKESGKFTHVVADTGKRVKNYLTFADLNFTVSDKKERRIKTEETSGNIKIINFSPFEGKRDGEFHIPDDSCSFVHENDSTEISMFDRFADSLCQMIREYVAEDGAES